MRLEDIVLEYILSVFKHDRYGARYCLDQIRSAVIPVMEKMGITWTDKTEWILKDACLNYSSSLKVSFLEFFIRRIRDRIYEIKV